MTIARRTGAEEGQLEPQVLAAMVAGAERAAVLHWARQAKPSSALADIVRTAIDMAARLSVASLNTRGIAIRGSRLASRYTVIATEFEAGRADVVCFQEVFTYWHLRLLARRMPSFRHVSYRPSAIGRPAAW